MRRSCAWCGATNRPNMAFCCECGESLDAAAPPEQPLPGVPADRAPADRSGSWEVRLGVALLLIVAVVAVVAGWQDAQRATQARLYARAQADLARGGKVAALAAFREAGNYADALAQAARLAPEVANLETHYTEGVRAATGGAWWDAAWALGQAADIQVSYQDVITQLRQARFQSGPLFYRNRTPDGGLALWSVQADGRDVRRLPWSDRASALLALDPGSRWAVCSGGPGPDPQHAGPFLLDLTTGQVLSLAQKYRSLDRTTAWARFRPDSQGFWWGDAGQTYYYDLPAGRGLPLSEQPGAIDPLHARLLLNRLLLPTLDELSSRLLLSDPIGRVRTLLAVEPQEVASPSFSDDGRYLLYTLVAQPVLDRVGHLVTTPTLVLNDLLHPEAPVRTVLSAEPLVLGAPPDRGLQAAFLPGSHTVFAVSGDGADWAVRAWTGAGAPVLLASARSLGTAAPLAQVLPLPNGAGVALSLGGPQDAPAMLLLVDPAGQQTRVAAHLLGGRWLAFSDDGHQALITRAGPAAAGPARSVGHLDLQHLPSADAGSSAGVWWPATLQPAAAGSDPVFTRDGGRVLLVGTVSGAAGLYAVRADGSDPLLIVPGATAFWSR